MNALRRLGTVGSSSSAAQDKAAAAAAQGLDSNGKPLERHFGLENFGNTCYCNAVLQALYFCKPFRELLELSSLTYTLGEDGVYRPIESVVPTIAQLSSALSTKEPGSPRQPGPTRTASGMRIPGVILAPEPASRPSLLPRKTAPNSPSQVRTPLSPLNTSQPLSPVLGPPVASPLQTTPTVVSPGPGDDKAKKGALSRGMSVKTGTSGARGLFKKGLTMSSVPTISAKQPNSSESSRSGTGDGTSSTKASAGGNDALQNVSHDASSSAPLTQSTAKTLDIPSNSQSNPTTAMSPSGAVKPPNQTLFTALRDLFSIITHQPKQSGVVAPQSFVQQLRQDNEVFRGTMHQDAHEFFNFLMNEISEQAAKQESERQKLTGAKEYRPSNIHSHIPGANAPSWVQDLFLGVLTNETRCLSCETVTSRDEAFLDLSIDIEQNTSVTACLRQFSKSEMLQQRDKYSCERCCSLQEAEKRMKIKKLPNILALHLKRFKYQEDLQRFMKLTYRVVFPLELRLFNTVDDAPNADRLYRLWAIVIHIGAGLHHGHYVAIVRSGEKWLLFDDDTVTPIEESEIPKYFGDTPGYGSGYVLFYQSVELDVESLLPLSVREGRRVEREAKAASLADRATRYPVSPTVSSAPFTSNQLYSIPQGDSPHLSPLYTASNLEKADPFATPVRELRNPFDPSPLVDDGSDQRSKRTSIGQLRRTSGDDLSQRRPGSSGNNRSPSGEASTQPPWSSSQQQQQQQSRGTSALTEAMQMNARPSTRRQHSLTLSTNVPPLSVAAAVASSSRGSSPARSKTEAPSPTTYKTSSSPFAPNGVHNAHGEYSPLSVHVQSATKDKEKEKGKWWKLGKK